MTRRAAILTFRNSAEASLQAMYTLSRKKWAMDALLQYGNKPTFWGIELKFYLSTAISAQL